MDFSENGNREKPERGTPGAGEKPKVTELASHLTHLLETLKETTGAGDGTAGGDGKLSADVLAMAESLFESLEPQKEKPQQGTGSDGASKEDPPVLRQSPVIETETIKEKPEMTGKEVPKGDSPESALAGKESVAQTERFSDEQLFTGEMKLIIIPPVNLGTVLKLYNYLQTVPDIKLVYTSGARDTDITIKITVDKPTPITSLLSRISGVSLAAEDTPVKDTEGKSTSLLDKKNESMKEIRLICRD